MADGKLDAKTLKEWAEHQCSDVLDCWKHGNVHSRIGDLTRALLAANERAERLAEALKLASDAMEYMGEILNNHDMVLAEDEEKTTAAFDAVRAALAGLPVEGRGK